MKKLHITEAEAIAQRIGADAVVILAFNGNVVAGASYGQTKSKCTMIGKWMDRIIDDMEAGYILSPQIEPLPRR